MATKQVIRVNLRRPHAEQQRFIESKAKRKVIRAGRRGGKTVGIGILAVRAFLAGRRVLYATPTGEQITTFWYEVKEALRDAIDAGVFVKNESMHTIERPHSKARIRAKTAWNAESLRGDYGDLLIFDEYQLMAEDAWGVVGAPMLLDNNGDAVFIYTPPSIRFSGVSKAVDKRHAAKMYKKAAKDDTGKWAVFHFGSAKNPHISQQALIELASDMSSLAYRQEIEAEDIDEVPGALWKQAWIDADRVSVAPELVRIVVAVDPSCEANGDEAGIVACGKARDGHYYLLDDDSLQASPDKWAKAAIDLFKKRQADRIVAEKNQGGQMVAVTLGTIDKKVPVTLIHASRGKITRAEPIAALAEQHKIHHIGTFAKLESELCSYTGSSNEKSPNRLDAYVHGFTELHIGNESDFQGNALAGIGVFG